MLAISLSFLYLSTVLCNEHSIHPHHHYKARVHQGWREPPSHIELNDTNWGYKLDDWYRETVRNVTAEPDYRSSHSQGVQDHILNKIFNFITPKHKSFVEFGFDSRTYEKSMGANTAGLHRKGWKGLLLDVTNENPEINLHKARVTPETVVSIFESYNVPYDVDYISIDIDSVDAFVFYAILSSKYHPAVISSEYNCLLPLYSNLCNSGWDRNSQTNYIFNGDRLFGTSILPLKTVADMFGYSIVAVDVGLDVFFVRNDLLLHTAVLPYDHWGKYTANYTYYDDDGWIAVNKPRLPNYNKCWTEGAGNRRHNHTDLIDSYLIRFDEWLTNGFDIGKAAGGKVFEEVNKFHIVLDRHVP